MKKSKRFSIFVLAVIMVFAMSVPANADLMSSSTEVTIDAQLRVLLNDVLSTERIPVDIWLYETSTVEDREQRIYSKIGVNKAQIALDTRGAISSKQVDEYIMTERSMYAEERMQQYASIRQDYANIQGLQEKRDIDTRLFYSQYAPMISAELTAAEIKLLASDQRVVAIYHSPEVMLEDEGNISVPSIGADYVRDTLGFSGSGVKIGMLEKGLPDASKPYFASANIIYDNTLGNISANNFSHHANMVAYIMVGTESDGGTVEGIVPDAELYATKYVGGDNEDWRERVEWLLSQGVHVINMSAFLSSENAGCYHEQEIWLDHVANSHCVHFVKSSGNDTRYVSPPGMAYNIITVGAIDDKNDADEQNDVLYEGSNYVEPGLQTSAEERLNLTNKPDLVAPGVSIYTPAYIDEATQTNTGTSFAAPHVTAVIAQLCQRFWSLRVLQAGVKAMLTASIPHSRIAFDTSQGDSIMYDQYGAGVVNARAVFETANAYRMVNPTFTAGSAFGARKEYTFAATAGQHIRVSLTWLKPSALNANISHIDNTPNDLDPVNLSLCVYHPDGMMFGEWDTDDYNTEIADFFAPKTGTYKIAVCLGEPISNKVEFGLAWWLGPVNNLSTTG